MSEVVTNKLEEMKKKLENQKRLKNAEAAILASQSQAFISSSPILINPISSQQIIQDNNSKIIQQMNDFQEDSHKQPLISLLPVEEIPQNNSIIASEIAVEKDVKSSSEEKIEKQLVIETEINSFPDKKQRNQVQSINNLVGHEGCVLEETKNFVLEERKNLKIDKLNEGSYGQSYEELQEEPSKRQKLAQKIVMKEMAMMKRCIENLAGALNGLEYLKERATEDVTIKEKIRVSLKAMMNQMPYFE